MGNVRRVYVEKKEPYAVHAKELKEEIKRYLGIKDLTNVRPSEYTQTNHH